MLCPRFQELWANRDLWHSQGRDSKASRAEHFIIHLCKMSKYVHTQSKGIFLGAGSPWSCCCPSGETYATHTWNPSPILAQLHSRESAERLSPVKVLRCVTTIPKKHTKTKPWLHWLQFPSVKGFASLDECNFLNFPFQIFYQRSKSKQFVVRGFPFLPLGFSPLSWFDFISFQENSFLTATKFSVQNQKEMLVKI